MSDLVVHLPEETLRVDALAAGEASAFREVGTAFRIATTEGLVNGEPFRIQVIDHVGEEPLGAGRFTYVLVVTDPAGPTVGLLLRRED